uniref:C2 domain-containing protein n=1 Tax=Anopheles maculatus TaxID=74869 RepID=A0A182SE94_9DIPT
MPAAKRIRLISKDASEYHHIPRGFRVRAGPWVSQRLPDPFAKILVEGTTQEYTTEICKASLDPRWNSHYDLFLGKNDNIIISIYNHRKLHKRQAFLGCVRIVATSIQHLRDTGCK